MVCINAGRKNTLPVLGDTTRSRVSAACPTCETYFALLMHARTWERIVACDPQLYDGNKQNKSTRQSVTSSQDFMAPFHHVSPGGDISTFIGHNTRESHRKRPGMWKALQTIGKSRHDESRGIEIIPVCDLPQ